MSFMTIAPQGICVSCFKREATCHWSEGSIASIHGFVEDLCKLCVVTRQLAYAEEMSAKIGQLKKDVARLEKELPELSKEKIKVLTGKRFDNCWWNTL